MIKILLWDDESATHDVVEQWISDVNGVEVHYEPVTFWPEAVSQLMSGDWDIVISDMLEKEYRDRLHEHKEAWAEYSQAPSLQSLLAFPSQAIAPEFWQEEHMWGAGLMLLAKSLNVPEIFVLSAYVDTNSADTATSAATRAVLALTNAGVLRSGVLRKDAGCPWSKDRLLAAIQSCAERKSPGIPDLYEVVVLEDEGDDALSRRLRVTIGEKKTEKLSPELIFTGDHAIIFSTLAWAEGARVSGKALMRELNKKRGADTTLDTYSPVEVGVFLEKYGIQLLGEEPENEKKRMCRRDNDILCEWQRDGIVPIEPSEEGFTCLKGTRVRGSNGFCPKLGRKRQAPGMAKGLDNEGGSERRKVGELRQMLKPFDALFGDDFSSDKGLIRTFKGKGGGYALAGTMKYQDD